MTQLAEKKTITIHRALTELKTLDSRISKATNEVVAILANRKALDKVNGVPVDQAKKDMQASHDKVKSLIEYRNRIKGAVVQSNALTTVKIGELEMTVAQAIERKDSIVLEENLLTVLQRQYRSAITKMTQENDALPAKLETYLINILGSKDKQQNPDEVKMHTDAFMARNEYELIDPLNLAKVIEKLDADITEFKTEVDAVLSESNATTFIEVTV